VRPFLPAITLLALLSSTVLAQSPTLTLNGVTDPLGENNAVAHLKRLTPFTLEATGTPGAELALMISLAAMDGTGGAPDVDQGYFLSNFTAPNTDVSPHAVYDGIGSSQIESLLGLSPGSLIGSVSSPLFRFNANGQFVLSGTTPSLALFLNNSTGINPVEYPLESDASMGFESVLYLQVVELGPGGASIGVSNGVKAVFDELKFGGTLSYSEASGNPNDTTLGSKQTVGTLDDPVLDDATPATFTPSPGFSGFGGKFDAWIIELAGVHELYAASHLPGPAEGVGNWLEFDPDNHNIIQGKPNDQNLKLDSFERPSGINFMVGDRPAMNLENSEFPRIMLPGNRQLFHWRDGTNAFAPTYGFGVLFGDTGEFRNLVPASFGTFAGTSIRSTWDWEVGVTPDGDRALVVLDDPFTNEPERLFVLNLEPGGTFSNGEPIAEYNVFDSTKFRKIYEESFAFVKDNVGDWHGLFFTSDTGTAGKNPKFLNRVSMTPQGGGPFDGPIPIFPADAPYNFLEFNRQLYPSPDHKSVVFVGSYSSNNKEIVKLDSFLVFAQSRAILTAYPTGETTDIGEWGDATNGQTGFATFSPDGSLFAFARRDGSTFIPNVVQTDGKSAGSVQDLISDVTEGGDFDLPGDFQRSRSYRITPDNRFLLFMQGTALKDADNDRFDLFAVDLENFDVTNLSRTIKGGSLKGPWNPAAGSEATIERPTLDPSGTFVGPDGNYLFFFRDVHGLGLVDPELYDRFNLVAVDMRPGASGADPSLDLINVTGTEFEPFPGAGRPAFGAPDIIGKGDFSNDGDARYHQVRRVGGGGPFDSFYYMTGRKAKPAVGQDKIDQLLLFDGNAPAPAIFVTAFSTTSLPVSIQPFSRITNVVPSQTDLRVAFVMDADGDFNSFDEDLFALDLGAFAVPRRLTAGGAPFSHFVTRGSVHFLPGEPSGLVFGSGTIPRPGNGAVDGVIVLLPDNENPIDASRQVVSDAEVPPGFAPASVVADEDHVAGDPADRATAFVEDDVG